MKPHKEPPRQAIKQKHGISCSTDVAGHTARAALPATTGTFRDFPPCVVK